MTFEWSLRRVGTSGRWLRAQAHGTRQIDEPHVAAQQALLVGLTQKGKGLVFPSKPRTNQGDIIGRHVRVLGSSAQLAKDCDADLPKKRARHRVGISARLRFGESVRAASTPEAGAA